MDIVAPSNLRRALINCVVVLSAGAAAIHFAVIGDHFDEYWAYGMFFAIAAWLQLLWAIGLAASPSRWLFLIGTLGNTVIIAIWIISRTSGLPVGPHAGSPESVEFIDVLATGFEALIVVGSLMLLRDSTDQSRMGARAVAITTIAATLIVVPLTTAAIESASVSQKESDVFHEAPSQKIPHR